MILRSSIRRRLKSRMTAEVYVFLMRGLPIFLTIHLFPIATISLSDLATLPTVPVHIQERLPSEVPATVQFCLDLPNALFWVVFSASLACSWSRCFVVCFNFASLSKSSSFRLLSTVHRFWFTSWSFCMSDCASARWPSRVCILLFTFLVDRFPSLVWAFWNFFYKYAAMACCVSNSFWSRSRSSFSGLNLMFTLFSLSIASLWAWVMLSTCIFRSSLLVNPSDFPQLFPSPSFV